MSRLKYLRAADARRMRWKNDGGITTEIARHPAEDDFDWRISIAEITSDGDFSIFPGVDRVLMLLDGNGVELDLDGEAPVRLDHRFQQHAFSGEAPIFCRLIDGPTRDFNLMLRRDAIRGELYARPIVGPMVFFAENHVTWLVHVISGNAVIKDRAQIPPLEPGDTLVVASDPADTAPVVLTGAGEVVLAKLHDDALNHLRTLPRRYRII